MEPGEGATAAPVGSIHTAELPVAEGGAMETCGGSTAAPVSSSHTAELPVAEGGAMETCGGSTAAPVGSSHTAELPVAEGGAMETCGGSTAAPVGSSHTAELPGAVENANGGAPGSSVSPKPPPPDARRACTSHPDGNREIRAMCLAALPCIPVPVMASQEEYGEGNKACGEAVANSHDLIAHLMNVRACAEQDDVNRVRAVIQAEATRALMDRFDAWTASNNGSIAPPAEVAYDYFAEFTRRYIGCFLNGSGKIKGVRYTLDDLPDVRVYPIHTVRVGDPIHRAALDFSRSQDRIFGACQEWRDMFGVGGRHSGNCTSIPSDTPYASLIMLSAMRITTTGNS